MAKNLLDRPKFFKLCQFLQERAAGEHRDTLHGTQIELARDAAKALGFTIAPYSIKSAADAVGLKFAYVAPRAGINGHITKALRRDISMIAKALQRVAQVGGNFDGRANLLSLLEDVVKRNGIDDDTPGKTDRPAG